MTHTDRESEVFSKRPSSVRGWGVYMGVFMEGRDIQRVVVTLHRCIILKNSGSPPPEGGGTI